jgi:hypothetical protein
VELGKESVTPPPHTSTQDSTLGRSSVGTQLKWHPPSQLCCCSGFTSVTRATVDARLVYVSSSLWEGSRGSSHIHGSASTGNFSLIGDSLAFLLSIFLTSASYSLMHRTFLQNDDRKIHSVLVTLLFICTIWHACMACVVYRVSSDIHPYFISAVLCANMLQCKLTKKLFPV